jgi:S1-C subfamily serine protease
MRLLASAAGLATLLIQRFGTGTALAAADPYIGISHELSESPAGLKISVVPGAPGELCGLKSGDILTAINGVSFSSRPDVPFPQQLTAALKGLQVGDVVTFTVYRDSPTVSITRDGAAYDSNFPFLELPELVAKAESGVEILLRAVRLPQTMEIKVTLGARLDTTGPDIGHHTSMAIVAGAPAIAFYDATNTDLKYIRYNP